MPPQGQQEPPGTGHGAQAYQPHQPHQPQGPAHGQQARSPQQPQGHQAYPPYPPYQAYGAYEPQPQPQPHPYPGRSDDRTYPAHGHQAQQPRQPQQPQQAHQGYQAQQPQQAHQAHQGHQAQGYPAGVHHGQGHPAQDYAAHDYAAQAYAAPDHAAHDRPAPGPRPADAAARPAEAGSAGADADAGAEPGYGPATLAGNARITDAQRARAEGRSPIIEPGMQPAALTALLGLLLAAAAAAGTYVLLLPLVVLQAVTAAGWFRLNGMWPARQGIALGFLGALVADAALLVADRSPAAILGTLGVWVLLALVLQLRSHADPDERMYGLMATVAVSALAIVAGGYLAAGTDAVTVGAAAVAVAAVARALPLPTPVSVVVSLLAAAGAGIAVGQMTGIGTPGALLGAGAAVCALVGHRAASYDYPSRFVHFTAGVALPLAAAAPAVYLLGRAVG
ncbi:hypothetical protein ACF06Q_10825 [Streptomyces leeuwenhoekii]|uniref:hypothetical protein n=1 Tax=Streptomyces leeuwenhoekii TaxID=1437453 RepID=UPI0036FB7A85